MTTKCSVILILLSIVIGLVAMVFLFTRQSKFGRLPKGERLERVRQSPNYREGAFQNQHPTPQITSKSGRVGAIIDFIFGSEPNIKPKGIFPVIRTDLRTLSSSVNSLVWFGHSSCLMTIGGKRVLIDPVFEEASPVALFNRPFKGTDIYKPEDMPEVDYLIITHDHWDHLDHQTVLKLKDRTHKVVCPLGVGEHFEYWGFPLEQIIEMDWYEKFTSDDGFTIHCLPARHFSGRGFTPNQTLWASFLLESSSATVYLSGDGGYDTHFAEIARRFPSIDVAIMENGQYNEQWRYIHLLPEELKVAIKELGAKRTFTFHNAKYALAKHPWFEPYENMLTAAHTDSLNVLLPMIGEVVILDGNKHQQLNRWWE